MADAAPAVQNNNPSGEPPAPTDGGAAPSLEAEILDVLSLNDTPSEADRIAANKKAGGAAPAAEPPAAASSPASSEAGGGVAAPSSPPDKSTPQPNEGAAPPAAAEPAQGQPPAPAAPAPQAPPPAAPQPQPAGDPDAALREASLKATVDALQREIETLRASPQPAQQPPAAESGQPAAPVDQPFRYSLTLPKPIQDALTSGEPEQVTGAIGKIVNDLGTIVHNTVLAQVRSEVRQAFGWLFSQAENVQATTTRSSATEKAKEAYYVKFPDHKDALVLPLIQSEAARMAAEFPNLPWGDEYMNSLGARVNAAIATLRGQSQPAGEQPAVTNGSGAPPARPAAMLPSGNRGGQVTPGGDISDEIMGTLSPF